MKVAHLTTVDLTLRFLVFAQLKALRDEGHEVVALSAPGPWVADLEREGIRHVPLPSSTRAMNLGADARSVRELWRILRRERPHVLHTHTPKPGVYGRIIGRLAGIPIVVNTVHGLYATRDDPWTKRLAVYTAEAIASRFSDAELVQNPEDFEFMRRTWMTKRARLLGNGVDLVRFDPDRFTEAERDRIRKALGVRPDQVVVGAVGRLVTEKGYLELFESIRRLDDGDYLLVVVGPADPEKPDALRKDLIERARADGVHFLGQRDDIDALYAAMDVFVLASHREGYPRVAMEAAAMGVPVIATDIRGCREVVEPGHNGLLVPPRDADALGAAIGKLGRDTALRERMGSAGRLLARDRFDERRVARVVLDEYRDSAARKRMPTEPVDVLQVITTDDRRGAETHAYDLGVVLEARGLRVRTLALAPGPHGGGLGVPTLGRRPLGVATLRRFRRAASWASVVVAHGSKTLPACTIALAGTGVPVVYRTIGDPRHWANTPARRARLRAYMRRAQAVVALTPSLAAAVQSLYKLPRDRVVVIPTGVSPERNRPADAARCRAARNELGIPTDADVGAIVGALSPEKDVALAIAAAAGIRGFHLIIAGDGPEREVLERLATVEAPGRVHFLGSMRDPGPAYDAADLVLLTSRTEGMPVVPIEAGLRGLPVIGTDVGGMRETVVDGVTGVLVEPGNRQQLTSAITRVRHEGAQMGRSARQHCLGQFGLEHVADRWQLLLTGLQNTNATAASPASWTPPTLAAGPAQTAPGPRAGFKEQ